MKVQKFLSVLLLAVLFNPLYAHAQFFDGETAPAADTPAQATNQYWDDPTAPGTAPMPAPKPKRYVVPKKKIQNMSPEKIKAVARQEAVKNPGHEREVAAAFKYYIKKAEKAQAAKAAQAKQERAKLAEMAKKASEPAAGEASPQAAAPKTESEAKPWVNPPTAAEKAATSHGTDAQIDGKSAKELLADAKAKLAKVEDCNGAEAKKIPAVQRAQAIESIRILMNMANKQSGHANEVSDLRAKVSSVSDNVKKAASSSGDYCAVVEALAKANEPKRVRIVEPSPYHDGRLPSGTVVVR